MRSSLVFTLLLLPTVATFASVTIPIAAASPSAELGSIGGRVEDPATGEAIADAVVILACTCLPSPRRLVSDARGNYEFVDLPAGDYRIEVLLHAAVVTRALKLEQGAALRVDLHEPAPAMVPITRDFSAVVDLAPTASRDAAGISLAGTTGAESSYTVTAPPRSRVGYGLQPQPGVLTAGILDDNRSDELERFADGTTLGLAGEIGLGPRSELLVVDRRGLPVADAQLQIGQAHLRTGTDGRAIVNGRWDLGDGASARVRVHARKGEHEASAHILLGDQRSTRIVLPYVQRPAQARVRALDLVLVVDTTASMADELEWLATELRSVVAATLADHPEVDARLGVVAYRDHGDDYVTRSFPLTRDHDGFEGFLAGEEAAGGGDPPEAVDEALLAAAGFDWRHDQQAAKVVLWVGDAPPHADRVTHSFAATAKLRAAGVSIYPVVGSGIDEVGELVARTIAADTGAQYLFLTDDSGIGLPHAKPHADDYVVEPLADALTRVLAAELRGEQAALPQAPGNTRPRPARAAFELERSLLDDGGQRALLGGPRQVVDLL